MQSHREKILVIFNTSYSTYKYLSCMYLGPAKRIWYLSPMRAAKVQASLRIRAVSPKPPLLAHTSSESRGTFRKKARSLAPLNGWTCAVKVCHDGMLEDTNSLDGAHLITLKFTVGCLNLKILPYSFLYIQSIVIMQRWKKSTEELFDTLKKFKRTFYHSNCKKTLPHKMKVNTVQMVSHMCQFVLGNMILFMFVYMYGYIGVYFLLYIVTIFEVCFLNLQIRINIVFKYFSLKQISFLRTMPCGSCENVQYTLPSECNK